MMKNNMSVLLCVSVIGLMFAGPAYAVNLSLTATATTNSSYRPASNAIDGDYSTGWSARDHGTAGDPNWLMVDLGLTSNVSQIYGFWQLSDGLYAGYTTDYNFYTSSAGTDWVLRTSGTFIDESSNPSESEFLLNFGSPGLSMRYAKYEVVGGTHWSGLAELEIYGVNDELTAVPVPAAAWLFGSGLLGIISLTRRRKVA